MNIIHVAYVSMLSLLYMFCYLLHFLYHMCFTFNTLAIKTNIMYIANRNICTHTHIYIMHGVDCSIFLHLATSGSTRDMLPTNGSWFSHHVSLFLQWLLLFMVENRSNCHWLATCPEILAVNKCMRGHILK